MLVFGTSQSNGEKFSPKGVGCSGTLWCFGPFKNRKPWSRKMKFDCAPFLKIIQECQRASSPGVKTMTRPARNRSFDEFRSQIIRMQTSFHVSYFYSVDAEFAHFKTTHNSTNTHTTCMPCLCLCEIDTQLSFTGVLKRIISLLAATNETSTAVASTAVGAEATFLFG